MHNRFVPAVVMAVGIALAGWFAGQGFIQGRAADRYVTVKGISEREVQADTALWPIRFVATDDELAVAQQRIEKSRELVLSFLERHRIDPASAEVQGLEVNDRLANAYSNVTPESRYIINQTLMVRSGEPRIIAEAGQQVSELVDAGVVLSMGTGPYNGPTYLFTQLTELKPEMIAEATANARRAAEQFAKDSGSRIGGIRRANQGIFVILPRDQAPGVQEGGQRHKTVRVVSTVEYLLED
jgi:hypothetical protein